MSLYYGVSRGWGYQPDIEWPFCGAELFPLPHQAMAVYGQPPFYVSNAAMQGPAPAVCEREPHPRGTWHRSGGTWWT